MTAGELIQRLQAVPPETPIGVSVYGNSWYAPCHNNSHGALEVHLSRLHYAYGKTEDIFLIHTRGQIRDGYKPEFLS